MPFCTNCGAAVDGSDAVCPSCGQPMQQPESVAPAYTPEPTPAPTYQAPYTPEPTPTYQAPQQAYQVPPTQQYSYPAAAPAAANPKGSIGWAILGFFIPIVGLILFFVWKKDRPGDAKKALIGGIVGFVVGIIMSIVTMCTGLMALNQTTTYTPSTTTTTTTTTTPQDDGIDSRYVGTWNAVTFYAPDMGTYELDDFDLSGTITISKDGTVRLGGSMFEGASGLTDQLKDYNGAYALVENGQVHTTFTIKNGQLVMDYIGDGSDEDRYTLFCDKM